MTTQNALKHWFWSRDEDNVMQVTLNRADSSVNSLSREVLGELDELLSLVEKQQPVAVVLRSGKPNSFIVGADVAEFREFRGQAKVAEYIHDIHRLFGRLENLAIPTLALIEGACLGGGLELALACRYRIAVDQDATQLGFPEVKLGIHPGFGGTVRSIRQMGALRALKIMLSGRSLSPRQAARQGLVDAAVPPRVLDAAVSAFLASPPRLRKGRKIDRLLASTPLRRILATFLRRRVARTVDPRHYPAPGALIDLWQQYGGDPQQMLQAEANSIARLLCTPTAQNLVRVFFLQTQLKSGGKGASRLNHLHVIGAGTMGRDIAAWCALQGLSVSLQDLDKQALAQAVAEADKLFRRKLKKPYLVQAAHDRLMADPEGLGLVHADLVIEAIVEDLETKKQLYLNIEPVMPKQALLASNTSSIPLEELAEGLSHPERFLGIHFFNPVALMPLVEVVAATASSPQALERARSFVDQIRHLPLPVKSAPGFLVNRVLMPYLMAAVTLAEKGHALHSIDQAARDFGMPMGPLELADKVGLDICLSVAQIFSGYFDRPVPGILRQKVDKGHLGRKSGQGFYRYRRGKKVTSWRRPGQPLPDHELTRQLFDPLFAEAQACLAEGIVESADLVDAGMIFGTGFAPFTGGPLHYLQQQEETSNPQP